MSCCGHHRLWLRDNDANHEPADLALTSERAKHTSLVTLVYFEYVGKTALTVTGPVTGKKYRFPRPGAKIAVDGPDALSVAAIPLLRQTRGP